jgi:hypothetical protein
MATSGQDKITGGIVMIGSIFVITVLAGINEQLAKILLVFMLGVLLLWAMSNNALLAKWFGKIGAQSGPAQNLGNGLSTQQNLTNGLQG